MYAVIKTGGHQYRVTKGQKLSVEKLNGNVGDVVTFDQVLLVSDDKNGLQVGAPFLATCSVTGKIVEHFRGEKIIVFKYKRRKNYKRKKGHKQPLTRVEIQNIG
jgi:large subunit ribosomal protein L21